MYQNYSVWYSFKQFCKLLFSCRAICSGNAIKFGRKTHCFSKTGYVFRFGEIAVFAILDYPAYNWNALECGSRRSECKGFHKHIWQPFVSR